MGAVHGHLDDMAHVVACADCQARLGLQALDVDLDRAWLGVAATVWARRVGPLERWLGRVLRSPGLARALLTTPSLFLSWLIASAIVMIGGAWATYESHTPWPALLAPALAGAGIAYAYGPGVDPAFELSRSMVISDRLVLLARGLVVFGVNAAFGLVATMLGFGGQLTFGWLVPMTAVCALALAAAALSGSANVGVAAALAGWALAVLASKAQTGQAATAVTAVALMPVYVFIAVVCLGLAIYATGAERSESARWRPMSLPTG